MLCACPSKPPEIKAMLFNASSTASFRTLRFALPMLMALVLGGCQTAAPPPVISAAFPVELKWPIPVDVRTMAVNGYPMAYSDKGSGPTIVLVHGILSDLRLWFLQTDPPPTMPVVPLSSKYRTVAISLRHHWPEPWSGKDSDYSIAQHTADVIEFIRQLGGPVYLVGWSRGGRIALDVARSRPDLVTKLVLAEPVADSLLPAGDPVLAEQAKTSKEAGERLAGGDLEGSLQVVVDSASGAGSWSRMPEQAKQTIRDNVQTLPASIADAGQRVGCRDLTRVRMPVLIVVSGAVTPRYSRGAAGIANCLRQAEQIVIPDAAHNMNVMNPVAFNMAVAQFFER
jgi:esterase